MERTLMRVASLCQKVLRERFFAPSRFVRDPGQACGPHGRASRHTSYLRVVQWTRQTGQRAGVAASFGRRGCDWSVFGPLAPRQVVVLCLVWRANFGMIYHMFGRHAIL